MEFHNRPLEDNVNVSKGSHAKTFLNLFVSLALICFVVYFLLIGAVEGIVHFFPDQVESALQKVIPKTFDDEVEESEQQKNAQKIADQLVELAVFEKGPVKVHVIEAKEKNAFAFPGYHILITKPLIDKLSDEELAFVLAHEIGHYYNKDHLRGLGRGLVQAGVAVVITAAGGNDLGRLILGSINFYSLDYSRKQEQAADFFALDLQNKKYQNIDGAISSFEILMEGEVVIGDGKIQSYLVTHPLTHQRIVNLKERAKEKGYAFTE